MSLAVLYSRALAGLEAPLVTVEVHLAGGLPAFTIVGLPEAEVREARDRVRAASRVVRAGQLRHITAAAGERDRVREVGCRSRFNDGNRLQSLQQP